jgi:hypothetical protein
MAENTATDTINDDDLKDEALDRMDRTSGGKFTYSHSSPTTVLRRVGRL